MTATRPCVRDERGIALLTVLLLLMLTSSVLAGFLVVVTSDARLRGVDRTRTQAFYAAHAGLEKLTADLGNLFATDFSPETADIVTIEGAPPNLANVSFTAADGLGYDIAYDTDVNGDPLTSSGSIASGPFQGFIGLLTPYTITVTARMVDGAESRLERTMQTVSIPVFQFGIFSESDLSFFAGPNFDFGGRIHTNGNLFLASGSTLTLSNKVTAVNEIVRTHLANGWSVSSGYTGSVRPITAPGAYRSLTTSEGSLVGTLGSVQNEPTWTNISIGTYNGNIRNGRTGAVNLSLPLVSMGATPIDIVRRPVPGEDPLITDQRLFAQANLRILLSDEATDITGLPGVSPGTVTLGHLDDTPIPGYVVDANRAPLGVSPGPIADPLSLSPADTPLHGGVLKIEYRNAAGAWTDVTVEILNLGITRRNVESAIACAEPNPDAVLRIQRVKTLPSTAPLDTCANDSTVDTDYWPLVLYDTREAWPRDNRPTASVEMRLMGVMHYLDLDVNNLRRWLAGEIGANGVNVVNEDGYAVYFSDRRGNNNAGGAETAELGFEDIVNPADGNGMPNGVLDAGEDLNGNGALDVYGNTAAAPAGSLLPLNGAATLYTLVTKAQAERNRAIFFRRALKVSNGALGQLPPDGLTIVSENPVYVQGHYNANALGFGTPNAPAAIIADAVTLLSANWNDVNSLLFPNGPANRPAVTSWYRFATIAGKGRSFPHIGGTYQDYGTDGGIHNFLRFLERWSGQTLNYRGAIASLYFNRQAVGLYKCCTNVYGAPTRGYNFDTNFMTPSLLPPKTPMFRDVNTTGFTQVTRRQ